MLYVLLCVLITQEVYNPLTISLRIFTKTWQDRSHFEELVTLLSRDRQRIDEVAFFTSMTHAPLPLAAIEAAAAQLRDECLPAIRALGLRAGINHLVTIGHLDENPEYSLQEPWQHLVDISGEESASCYCASDPRVQEYIGKCYAALAGAGPDFIWIDDDVRLESHAPTIKYACFCDYCIDRFNRTAGHEWTRDRLRAEFNVGAPRERFEFRRQWLKHTNSYITELIGLIRRSVDEANPNVVLGLMTGEIAYSGYAYSPWVDAMAGCKGLEVKWRPGGGFYSDDSPIAMLSKVHSVGRQIACLPDSLTDIQYEVENFPFQLLRKSTTGFAAEISAALGAGCTGTALDILDLFDTPSVATPYLDKVRDMAGFFEEAAKLFGRSACEGIVIPFTPPHFAALQIEGNWEHAPNWGSDFKPYCELSEIGLPFGYSSNGGSVTLLTDANCVEYTPDELRSFLAGSVLMDGTTLERLEAVGLGELTGFRISGRKDTDSIERLTSHALNGEFAGFHRDCRPSFTSKPVHLLEPRAAGAECISEVVDFGGVVHGVTSGVYENSLGGRVAVIGYYPWHMIHTAAKSFQLKAVCRWLSRGQLPAYIGSCHKIALWCRRDSSGTPAMMLLNASLDAAERFEVCVAGDGAPILATFMDGHSEVVDPIGVVDNYATYRIIRLEPWQAVLLRHCPQL